MKKRYTILNAIFTVFSFVLKDMVGLDYRESAVGLKMQLDIFWHQGQFLKEKTNLPSIWPCLPFLGVSIFLFFFVLFLGIMLTIKGWFLPKAILKEHNSTDITCLDEANLYRATRFQKSLAPIRGKRLWLPCRIGWIGNGLHFVSEKGCLRPKEKWGYFGLNEDIHFNFCKGVKRHS